MARCSRAPALLVVLAITAVGCQGKKYSAPRRLGGQRVAAETLNQGHLAYQKYCIGCHGLRGDGKGPTASSMVPQPRDFTAGLFKFSAVPAGSLPTDEDLLRTLRRGLKGTHMPGWSAIPEAEARAVIQYLKTFSARWKSESPGAPVPVPPDPWRGRAAEAARRGEVVYHAVARCWQCHAAYLPRERILALAREEATRHGKPAPGSLPFRGGLERPTPTECSFGKLSPPDFLTDTLRASHDPDGLFRTIAAGIGGTPMPSWYKELTALDLWSLVRYVEELIKLKGTPRAEAARRGLFEP
jgi:cytochrome c oxidase cbb3-type subunit 2